MKTHCYTASVSRLPNHNRNRFATVLLASIALMVFCFPCIGQPGTTDKSAPEGEYVIIRFMDSSEKKLYNWSFLYRWADYDEEPPKGYTWSADTEKPSKLLFLKKLSDGTRIRIGSNEIAKFEMSWEKRAKVPGWLDRKSLTIVKTNGDRIVLPSPVLVHEYYIDKSALTKKKWAQRGTAYLYIIAMKAPRKILLLSNFHFFTTTPSCMSRISFLFQKKSYS